MNNDICIICGIPADHGYIVDPDHFENDNLLTGTTEHSKQYNHGHYAPFTIYATNDGKFFIGSIEMMETLENWGVDLCDNIPADEPLVEVKLVDGKCQYCIAREKQLKLF